MSFISRVWTALRTPRARYVGRDLQGNRFYERAIVEMGRPKRTVVYRDPEEMWDYVGGQKRLAIQWSSWLSHTRPDPPTLEELQADAERQIRVKHNASLIEARDREESERLKCIQAETRAELLGAPSRAPSESAAPQTPPTTNESAEATNTRNESPGTTDPWAEAAKSAPETSSWTPQLRKRGE